MDPVGPIASALSSTIRILELSFQLRAVGDQTVDLLRTTEHIDRNVREARRLIRIKETHLSPDVRSWMDDQIGDCEGALRDVQLLVEPARVSAQTEASIKTKNRVLWVLRDGPIVREKRDRMQICHSTLSTIIGILHNTNAVVLVPLTGTILKKKEDEATRRKQDLEAMFNWRKSRRGLTTSTYSESYEIFRRPPSPTRSLSTTSEFAPQLPAFPFSPVSSRDSQDSFPLSQISQDLWESGDALSNSPTEHLPALTFSPLSSPDSHDSSLSTVSSLSPPLEKALRKEPSGVQFVPLELAHLSHLERKRSDPPPLLRINRPTLQDTSSIQNMPTTTRTQSLPSIPDVPKIEDEFTSLRIHDPAPTYLAQDFWATVTLPTIDETKRTPDSPLHQPNPPTFERTPTVKAKRRYSYDSAQEKEVVVFRPYSPSKKPPSVSFEPEEKQPVEPMQSEEKHVLESSLAPEVVSQHTSLSSEDKEASRASVYSVGRTRGRRWLASYAAGDSSNDASSTVSVAGSGKGSGVG